MNLTGSLTESKYKEELLQSRKSLFSATASKRLLDTLRVVRPNLRTAYILDQFPDEDEDVYIILVDLHTVVAFELNRGDGALPDVDLLPVKEYQLGLSRSRRIKLAIAMDLLRLEIAAAPSP